MTSSLQQGAERLLTMAVAFAALAVGATLTKRLFWTQDLTGGNEVRPQAPRFMSDWEEVFADFTPGPRFKGITVVELSDLECPFCARFHKTLRRLDREHPGRFRSVFVHFPLSSHRFANVAANAAECARSAGVFDEFVDSVFSQQDSIGLKAWSRFASEAGVTDTATFAECVRTARFASEVKKGRAVGERIGVSGTPTLIINGWRLSGVPSDSILDAVLSKAALGVSR